jgi:hypothetical protein
VDLRAQMVMGPHALVYQGLGLRILSLRWVPSNCWGSDRQNELAPWEPLARGIVEAIGGKSRHHRGASGPRGLASRGRSAAIVGPDSIDPRDGRDELKRGAALGRVPRRADDSTGGPRWLRGRPFSVGGLRRDGPKVLARLAEVDYRADIAPDMYASRYHISDYRT